MTRVLCKARLAMENGRFAETGGISHENRSCGFVPAFQDPESRTTCVSRYADGRPAPLHVLDGVPDDWVLTRDPDGHVLQVKACIVSGFLRDGRFYTRDEAAAAMRSETNSAGTTPDPLPLTFARRAAG